MDEIEFDANGLFGREIIHEVDYLNGFYMLIM